MEILGGVCAGAKQVSGGAIAPSGDAGTDVDEINPLGIQFGTEFFSILDGIEAIRSVPKKYQTQTQP